MKHRYIVSVDTVGKQVSVREYAAAGGKTVFLFSAKSISTSTSCERPPRPEKNRWRKCSGRPTCIPAEACAMRMAEAIETLMEPHREGAREVVIDDPDTSD